jgi:hypothetical protein
MLRFFRRANCALAASALLVMAVPALASTIKLAPAGSSGSGPYQYLFEVTLNASGELVLGPNNQTAVGGNANFGPSMLTLYDIAGMTGASYVEDVLGVSTFSTSIAGTGVTPLNPNVIGLPLLSVSDSPALDNVTLTYTGPSGLQTSSLPNVASNGDKLLGMLTVDTTTLIPGGTFLPYAMQDNTLPSHVDEALLTSVQIPIPEPAAGLGILTIGLIAQLRRRSRRADHRL